MAALSERRLLLQVGRSTWVSLVDVVAIEWDGEAGCPSITLPSGVVILAPMFTGDTREAAVAALVRRLRKVGRKHAVVVSAKSLLTPRESEVLDALVQGLSTVEVAKALYMSESTVKEHTTAIYKKLEVNNRASMVTTAIHLGIIDPDPMSGEQTAPTEEGSP